MIASRSQCTIARAVRVTGRGYWSGRRVQVEFRPAPANSGLTFVRTDLTPPVRIPARVSYRDDAPRRTNLAAGGASVDMVEHVLAALAGLGIDNCDIAVDSAEMPAFDGSAAELVEALADVQLADQAIPTRPLRVTQPVRVAEGAAWVEARPPIGDGLSIEYRLDYGPDSPIGSQWFVADINPISFRSQLASCRTFLLESEAQFIRAQGVAQHVTPRDLLIFGPDGPVDNELRFADECVRHKILDVVGDLALAGRPLLAHIVAYRSGHSLNGRLVTALLAANDGLTDLSRRSA